MTRIRYFKEGGEGGYGSLERDSLTEVCTEAPPSRFLRASSVLLGHARDPPSRHCFPAEGRRSVRCDQRWRCIGVGDERSAEY
jgi:hypothetical protein